MPKLFCVSDIHSFYDKLLDAFTNLVPKSNSRYKILFITFFYSLLYFRQSYIQVNSRPSFINIAV